MSNKINYKIAYFKKVIENIYRKELGKRIDIDNFEVFTDKLEDTQTSEYKDFVGGCLIG